MKNPVCQERSTSSDIKDSQKGSGYRRQRSKPEFTKEGDGGGNTTQSAKKIGLGERKKEGIKTSAIL